MKTSLTLFKQLGALMRTILVMAVLFLSPRCTTRVLAAADQDTVISSYIIKAITAKSPGLYFPASVKRFYENNGYQLTWIAPATVKTHASEAMLMLDCVCSSA
ncbi:MAG: hypothetical protein NVSMB24_34430 [Mucilaginibacter sp.]